MFFLWKGHVTLNSNTVHLLPMPYQIKCVCVLVSSQTQMNICRMHVSSYIDSVEPHQKRINVTQIVWNT